MGREFILFSLIFIAVNCLQAPFPSSVCPFVRELMYQKSDPMKGNDVTILQYLIQRSSFVTPFNESGIFDVQTKRAVADFQKGNQLKSTGIFDFATAQLILKLHLYDNYKDNGKIPPGYLYKVHVPVYKNRTIETIATLYDSNMKELLKFTVKTHGQNHANGEALNMLCSDGSTPTGLMTFDLNSPEKDVKDFGPYPINRAIKGQQGNAKIVISDIRDGILMHTGEWAGWNNTMQMPNSHGCIHSWPEYIEDVWKILVSLGVQVRPNTFGQLPYPYKPQGILSVEQLD